MQPVILIFLGAGLGGVLRHGVNILAARVLGAGFPYGTVIINISGSFFMGLLMGWLTFRAGAGWTQHARLFIATGVLGGYTTFSTFSLETVLLIERNEVGLAALYVGASVVIGILGLWAGLALIRSLS
jgi:CrcB protein